MQGVINAYRHPPSIDCDAELDALGSKTCRAFLRFARKVISGRVDHWEFQAFTEYRDVPVYNAEFSGNFILVAVEDDPDDGITMTVMLALRLAPARIGNHDWDGSDMGFIRESVLLPRMRDLFGE